jgi:hypothetical protein
LVIIQKRDLNVFKKSMIPICYFQLSPWDCYSVDEPGRGIDVDVFGAI